MSTTPTPSTDVVFDLNQAAPKASTAGYTREICEKLENDGLVKFRESFVKKLIKTPLSSNLQVSTKPRFAPWTNDAQEEP